MSAALVWLPIRECILFQMLVRVWNCLTGCTLIYLKELYVLSSTVLCNRHHTDTLSFTGPELPFHSAAASWLMAMPCGMPSMLLCNGSFCLSLSFPQMLEDFPLPISHKSVWDIRPGPSLRSMP